MTQLPAMSLSWGGGFRSATREAAYRAGHHTEYLRQIRLVFFWASIFNILFVFNDWRLLGQPHFPATLAARGLLISTSLACLALVGKARNFSKIQLLCLGWSVPVIAGSAVLLHRATDVALFVVFILPVIFYLVLPLAFIWLVATGGGCGLLCLAAYLSEAPDPGTRPGLLVAMLMLNVVLALVVSRSNRLQRLAWAATRSEQATNRTLSEHRRMLETLLRAVPAPLIILARGSGLVLEANDAAWNYFGATILEDPQAAEHVLDPKDLARLAADLSTSGQVVQLETRIRLAAGVRRDVLLVVTLVEVQGTEAVLAIVVDITERKELEAHLMALASTDSLTGLCNRAHFFTLANTEIQRAHRYGRPLAVVMFDIDYFKNINDTCGHEAGDRALRAIGELCRVLARQTDIVGRLGGEEFALLLPETTGAEALPLAERLRAGVEAMRCPELPLSMTVSVGVADVLPGEGSLDAALSRADQALYAAKRSGRNRVVSFSDAEVVAAEGAFIRHC